MTNAPKLPRKGWKTYAIGILTMVTGALAGADWSEIFSQPETIAAVGAGMVFARALVAAFRAAGKGKG